MSHSNILDTSKTALAVIDVQEAFRSSIPEFSEVAGKISMAVRGCSLLNIPVILTEQYPKGLGHTAEEIQLALPEGATAIDKVAFSSCGSDAFIEQLLSVSASQIVLCGIETHICVSQTAHDLIDRGFQVHLLVDAVSSRFSSDKEAGLRKMYASGVIASSVEMMLFELMRDSKHEQFKEIQKLIR
jgi:nicotinamidase-related amidase